MPAWKPTWKRDMEADMETSTRYTYDISNTTPIYMHGTPGALTITINIINSTLVSPGSVLVDVLQTRRTSYYTAVCERFVYEYKYEYMIPLSRRRDDQKSVMSAPF